MFVDINSQIETNRKILKKKKQQLMQKIVEGIMHGFMEKKYILKMKYTTIQTLEKLYSVFYNYSILQRILALYTLKFLL